MRVLVERKLVGENGRALSEESKLVLPDYNDTVLCSHIEAGVDLSAGFSAI